MVNVLEYDRSTGNVTLAGLSTDTKPKTFPCVINGIHVDDPCVGSTFLEVNTQNVLFWDGTDWA